MVCTYVLFKLPLSRPLNLFRLSQSFCAPLARAVESRIFTAETCNSALAQTVDENDKMSCIRTPAFLAKNCRSQTL
jgi:hypothetical protein